MFLLPACSSVSYYWEKIQGHAEILDQQRPLQDVIDDPETAPEIKQRLINVQAARNFASKELLLPDNNSYRNYADIGRDYVVWTVVATPPYSVKAEQWCFLFVGCLSYRGYFSRQTAEEFANELKQQGKDVYVAGTKAYSTLGWFDDPLLNTMLYKNEAYRVGIIFHELAHQKMYVEDDTDFNEAFATTVEQQGVKRWFLLKGNKPKYKKYLLAKKRDEQFKQLLLDTKEQLKNLYAKKLDNTQMQNQKQQVFKDLQQRYQQYKSKWNNYSGYDKWMSQDLNNAHLALVATYNDLIPAFRGLFKAVNNDFKMFYKQVNELKEFEIKQRHRGLIKYAEKK